MDFLQRTPFFRLLVPFIIAIVFYQYFSIEKEYILFLVAISTLLITATFFIKKPALQFQLRWMFGAGVFIFIFSLATVLCKWQSNQNSFSHLHHEGIYQVKLISAPVEKQKSFQCKVELLQTYESNKWLPSKGNAILYIQKNQDASQLMYGDHLLVRALFTSPEKVQNPCGFDYANYLKRQGIGATCYIPSDTWKKIAVSTNFSLFRAADSWRNRLLDIFRFYKIDGDEFAVLAALTLGYTDDLQPDLRQSYSATGAMHILSVSGMHVGVVYVVIAFLLSFLNKNQKSKILKTIFIALFLWAYAFLSGLSPAVIRATLMFSFVALATCFERKSQMYNTIFMSILFMLIVNPNYLFDVGFQLSYAAVLSIVFFQPIFNQLYTPSGKIAKFLWGLFSVSIAAQLGTTPITLYYFQQFPNYFLLTNLLAIPLSTVVIYLAIALLLLSPFTFVAKYLALILKWSLWLLNMCIVWIQQLPHSISPLSITLWQMLFLFLAIFLLSYYLYSKKFVPIMLGLCCILVTLILNLNTIYKTYTSNKLIVFAGQKASHVNFVFQNNNYVYSTDSAEMNKLATVYWRSNKLNQPSALRTNDWCRDGFVSFDKKRVLILNKDLLKYKTNSKPLQLDFLIITSGLKPKIEQILENFSPKTIIVDNTISAWYQQRIKSACEIKNIFFYSVKNSGAFVFETNNKTGM